MIDLYTRPTPNGREIPIMPVEGGPKENPYLAGGDYPLADIATYPRVARHAGQGIDLDRFPNVRRWFEIVSGRPAVEKGMQVPA